MLLQVGVKVLIKNKDNKYLLLHRNIEKYPEMKGRALWDIVGGRIEPGVSLEENLKREIKEETDLDFTGAFSLIAAQDILRSDKHVVRLTYVTNLEGDDAAIKLSNEHDKYTWFKKKRFRKFQ